MWLIILPMGFPVLHGLHGQGLITDEQQVLHLLLLGDLCEVKVPSDDHIAVDAHDLGSLTSICTKPVDASKPSRGNAPDGNFSLTMFVIGVPPMCPSLWPLPRHHWNGR